MERKLSNKLGVCRTLMAATTLVISLTTAGCDFSPGGDAPASASTSTSAPSQSSDLRAKTNDELTALMPPASDFPNKVTIDKGPRTIPELGKPTAPKDPLACGENALGYFLAYRDLVVTYNASSPNGWISVSIDRQLPGPDYVNSVDAYVKKCPEYTPRLDREVPAMRQELTPVPQTSAERTVGVKTAKQTSYVGYLRGIIVSVTWQGDAGDTAAKLFESTLDNTKNAK
ncbi:hypothetical protein [Mycobacterium sp. NPDC050853]|uniref:hypothetical protein n=1 Tax=Mycobacterium sp. NPDC050853 TaxID=3155160 RepID=UPI003409E016